MPRQREHVLRVVVVQIIHAPLAFLGQRLYLLALRGQFWNVLVNSDQPLDNGAAGVPLMTLLLFLPLPLREATSGSFLRARSTSEPIPMPPSPLKLSQRLEHGSDDFQASLLGIPLAPLLPQLQAILQIRAVDGHADFQPVR